MRFLTPANFYFFAFLSARKAEEDFFLEIVYSYTSWLHFILGLNFTVCGYYSV